MPPQLVAFGQVLYSRARAFHYYLVDTGYRIGRLFIYASYGKMTVDRIRPVHPLPKYAVRSVLPFHVAGSARSSRCAFPVTFQPVFHSEACSKDSWRQGREIPQCVPIEVSVKEILETLSCLSVCPPFFSQFSLKHDSGFFVVVISTSNDLVGWSIDAFTTVDSRGSRFLPASVPFSASFDSSFAGTADAVYAGRLDQNVPKTSQRTILRCRSSV